MPVPGLQGSTSLSTYQNFDGTNLTIGGVEEKAKSKNGSAAVFLGIGTDFSKDVIGVLDFKGTLNYDPNGIINQNLRVRNTVGTKSSATQIRYSPLSVNVPVGKNTSLYANPHYVGKYNYKTEKWTNSAGVFAGVTQKLSPKTSLSLEVQRYNLQDIKDNSGKNWGVNIIVSHNL